MDFTIIEINKHKLNIVTLSNKLNTTFNINEEISLNNEIKKETEILLSLLNIKKNILSQNNNDMNHINPMLNFSMMNQNKFQQQPAIPQINHPNMMNMNNNPLTNERMFDNLNFNNNEPQMNIYMPNYSYERHNTFLPL